MASWPIGPTGDLVKRVIVEEAEKIGVRGDAVAMDKARHIAKMVSERTGVDLMEPGPRYDFNFAYVVRALQYHYVQQTRA